MDKKTELHDFIMTIKDLPTLPAIVLELLSSLSDERISVDKIITIIEKDPVLAAKIFRVINSPYYSLRYNVTSLKQAVVLLGLKEIKKIIIGTSVINTFQNTEDSEFFDRVSFWQHCMGCGKVAEFILERVNPTYCDEAFLAGLLHDIGKIIFNIFFYEQFLEVLKLCRTPEYSFRQAEVHVLGADHAEAGTWLAERWTFPENVKDVIANHHHLDKASNKTVAAAVRLADLLCKTRHLGSGADDSNIKLELRKEQAWKILKDSSASIGELDIERFTFEIEDELDKIEEFVKEAIK